MNWNLNEFIEVDVIIDELPEENYSCERCRKVLQNYNQFLCHCNLMHRDTVTEHDVLGWWSSISETELGDVARKYFVSVFNTTDRNLLMQKFSKDGISIIPSIFSQLTRFQALEMARKMFDQCLNGSSDKEHDEEICITYDDRHILEYIGGYIIQRMMKRSKDTECQQLSKYIDPDASAPHSLITIFQNDSFGSLTVPTPEITNFLVEIEKKFRKNYDCDQPAKKILSCVRFSVLFKCFGDLDQQSLSLLLKIARYFVKIRCHQKARSLKKKFDVKCDQNVSLRKSLK